MDDTGRRDALLTVLAVGLLLAPTGVSALHLTETRYHYKRVRVTTNRSHGIDYANWSAANTLTTGVPVLSRSIACSDGTRGRDCAFERYLEKGHTIPVGWATNPNMSLRGSVPNPYYRYAIINGTAYATRMRINDSIQNKKGEYRIDLALREEPVSRVLRAVSLNASQQRNSIPPVVYRAAKTGSATSYQSVDLPQTPIRTSNGSYYRVFLASRHSPAPLLPVYHALLTYGLPLLGIAILYRVFRRRNPQENQST